MKGLRFSFASPLPPANPTTIFGREALDPDSTVDQHVSIRVGIVTSVSLRIPSMAYAVNWSMKEDPKRLILLNFLNEYVLMWNAS